jgi:hypothetical protein
MEKIVLGIYQNLRIKHFGELLSSRTKMVKLGRM